MCGAEHFCNHHHGDEVDPLGEECPGTPKCSGIHQQGEYSLGCVLCRVSAQMASEQRPPAAPAEEATAEVEAGTTPASAPSAAAADDQAAPADVGSANRADRTSTMSTGIDMLRQSLEMLRVSSDQLTHEMPQPVSVL
eukprot:TRINITY_DN9234_c0_g1_i2.p4 TRINITY_DN9234_c0_g1~~TRINITY_DN9234_c0_g1_i2.p4  ORF type:complete len:138 (+),score=37.53 TRINITY_DN9234_c0_g1_i2:629-1042(+)